MTINHNFYLNLAFRQAEKNLGKTKLNPSVGAVVVKNDSVISTGVTSINGRPHAEFNALKHKINYINADLYVTIEPCTHYGLTPPCVNIIKKKQIKNVYYSFNDPDKRTFKKAKLILEKNKITTKQFFYNRHKDFYKSYLINKKNKIPYVSAKIAVSKDFFTISKKSKWITNSHSRKISHLIRSQFDCLISTSKSINKDNSLLNCRIKGINKNKPDLFILDLDLKLKKNLLLTKLNNKRKTFIITKCTDKKKLLFYKKINYKVITIRSLNTTDDFHFLFKKLFKLGYSRILFETGLILLNELIKNNLLNNLYLFQNNKKLGKNGNNNISSSFLKRMNLRNIIKVNLDDDKLYKIKIN
jgi:diaminohydroxyphosphoribosylaminopyrimidine deaminase / 5-amino-6-(5-phosphoribosylamino)uracil reductase